MPKGPLMLNPNQLFSAIHNEVIPAKVGEKLISLQNIRSLFGATSTPFYAGFGNKLNDYTVYRSVEISEKKIFIVNTNGEIKDQSKRNLSYSIILNEIADYFP
jgi:phosphatidate phosphatase LPIN